MKWLVLIHVLSAIVGVGPTFFAHVLLRRKQSIAELRQSLALGKKLEFFPKIGGTLAVLTGLALILIEDYGQFTQLWLIGSLILYVIIQVIVVGVAAPRSKKLAAWVFDPGNAKAESLPAAQLSLLSQVNGWFYAASGCGLLLFIFMILKP